MKTIRLTEESKRSLTGKTIHNVGDDYITLSDGMRIYLSEDEIADIGGEETPKPVIKVHDIDDMVVGQTYYDVNPDLSDAESFILMHKEESAVLMKPTAEKSTYIPDPSGYCGFEMTNNNASPWYTY